NAPAAAIAPSAGCPVAAPITSGRPTPSAARVARPGASPARLKARARPTPAGRRIQVILPCRSGIAQTVCLVSVYAHPRLPPCADFVSALLPTGGADLMTTTSEPTATAVALPLTTFQRIMLRDLLHESWRAHVVNITNLAVRFHTREEPAVAARLAAVRRQ